MEFTVFLTVLISNLRDEELFHFFRVPILTENVYWKLLKYNLSMLILTQNMQIFMELRYESLICDLQCGRPVAENLTQSYFFLFFFFLSLTSDQLLLRVLMVLKFIYHIVLTLSGEIFARICFCESNFPGILRGFNFTRSLLK